MNAFFFRLATATAFLSFLLVISLSIGNFVDANNRENGVRESMAEYDKKCNFKKLKPWELFSRAGCEDHQTRFEEWVTEDRALENKRDGGRELAYIAFGLPAGILIFYYLVRWVCTGSIRPLIPKSGTP